MGLFGDVGEFVSSAVGGIGGMITGKPTEVSARYEPEKKPFETTAEQQNYLNYLQAKAYRPQQEVPSAAQAMLQRGTQQGIQKMQGAIGSARGVTDPSMLAYTAARQAGSQVQDAAGQATILRAQEDAQRRGEQFQQEQLLGQQLSGQGAGLRDLEKLRANIAVGQQTAEMQAAEGARNRQSQFMGGLGAAASTLGAASIMAPSDIKVKKDIEPAQVQTKDYLDFQYKKMLDQLQPYSYEYKNKEYGKGDQLGVMAQDMEKSNLGNSMVGQDKNGTKNIKANISTVLAGQAMLNERLNKMENQQSYLDYINSMKDQGMPSYALDEMRVTGKMPGEAAESWKPSRMPDYPMKLDKVPVSPMPSPSKIPATEQKLEKVPVSPMEAPVKIDEEGKPMSAEMAQKMKYLDFLRSNYDNTMKAFSKNYNQLG